MSSRRFPKTPLWQRYVRVGRHIYGKSFRRRMEQIIGIERGMLRATIDRDDIPDAEQWQWDEWLISILRRDEEDLAGMMSASANLRSDVAEERERRTLAKAKKEHHITWAEIWAGHPAEAALRQMHPGWLESEEAAT